MNKEKIRTLMERLEKCVEQIEAEADVNEAGQLSDIDTIIQTVAEFYRITPSLLRMRNRAHVYCWPRHVAAYFVRIHSRLPLQTLAPYFGYGDHGSVLHGIERIKTAVEINDRGTRKEIERLSTIIQSKLNERIQQSRNSLPQLSQKAA